MRIRGREREMTASPGRHKPCLQLAPTGSQAQVGHAALDADHRVLVALIRVRLLLSSRFR